MKKTICVLFVLFMIVSSIKGNDPHEYRKALRQNVTLQYKDTIPSFDLTATYYWYNIKLKLNKETKEIYIDKVTKRISSGIILNYEKSIFKSLQKGNDFIFIGPFKSREEASISRDIYIMVIKNTNSTDDLYDKEFYWWYLQINPDFRKIKHAPFLISNLKVYKGNIQEYLQILKSFPKENMILQGPYLDYQFINIIIKKNYFRIYDNIYYLIN
jgi:hypothetical protein